MTDLFKKSIFKSFCQNLTFPWPGHWPGSFLGPRVATRMRPGPCSGSTHLKFWQNDLKIDFLNRSVISWPFYLLLWCTMFRISSSTTLTTLRVQKVGLTRAFPYLSPAPAASSLQYYKILLHLDGNWSNQLVYRTQSAATLGTWS